jgi:hypothetical protein
MMKAFQRKETWKPMMFQMTNLPREMALRKREKLKWKVFLKHTHKKKAWKKVTALQWLPTTMSFRKLV